MGNRKSKANENDYCAKMPTGKHTSFVHFETDAENFERLVIFDTEYTGESVREAVEVLREIVRRYDEHCEKEGGND